MLSYVIMPCPEITATSTTNVAAAAKLNATADSNPREPSLTTIISDRIKLSITSVLINFHAGYFRISLSLAGQALLWKTLSGRRVIATIHPSTGAVVVLWWSLALLTLVILSLLYLLKCVFCFKMVKSEFLHHVGVNYLFVPWISCLLLLQSAPFLTPQTTPYLVLWWFFAAPVIALDVKIYGQWFTKGKRFLSAVANPTSQLSVIGNLVGIRLFYFIFTDI